MENIISVRNIKKTYHKNSREIFALSGIDLDIKRGEFLSIMGASGSGKSTLMNIIGCLDTQTEGTCTIFGKDTSTLSKQELSQLRSLELSYIFQSYNLISSLSALENTALPLMYRRIPKAKREKIAKKALEDVGLIERIHHLPSEMSGGQQQRTAVARTLACNPEIIFADEPTGNLDSESSSCVINMLRRMNDNGKTIILITHDPKVALYADRIIRVENGMIQT
ncbi:MAG: ABC transporter ATP-binding protein [Oscillospiraceae bacterium]|nr:ABC transporter ATP-binding protein [Oscillospiraceae bacterium]